MSKIPDLSALPGREGAWNGFACVLAVSLSVGMRKFGNGKCWISLGCCIGAPVCTRIQEKLVEFDVE